VKLTFGPPKHLIVTLAHYLADGHQLDWTELAAHADPECQEEEGRQLVGAQIATFRPADQGRSYERADPWGKTSSDEC
jgi:hypothetical protein